MDYVWLTKLDFELISGNNRLSKLTTCLETAKNFLLLEDDAKKIFDMQKEIINNKWDIVCEEAKLSEVDKNLLWRRQFLNSFATEDKYS